MAPGKSSDEDGSDRSRSVRDKAGGKPRELRRPKQETLDQLDMTLRSVQESLSQETRTLDLNDNIRFVPKKLLIRSAQRPTDWFKCVKLPT